MHLYNLESNKYNRDVFTERLNTVNAVRKQILEMKKAQFYFLLYSIMEVVSNQMNLNIYSSKFNVNEFMDMSDKLLEDFEIEKLYHKLKNKNPLVFVLEIYLKLLKAFSKPSDTKRYEEYKSCVHKYQNKLSRDEVSFHFSRMISYNIIKVDFLRADDNTADEIFNLYETFLSKQYYITNRTHFLHKDLYRAIVIYATRLKRTDWLKHFIEKHSRLLHPNDECNLANLAYAYYYHTTEEYDTALEHLNILHTDQLSHRLDVHNLKLRIYYDMGNYMHLPELIHTYKENLRANKLLTNVKRKNYNNFVKYLEKLVLYKLDGKRKYLGYYFKSMSKQSNLAFRDWLTEKFQRELNIYIKTA